MSETPYVERFRSSVIRLRKQRGLSQNALANAMADAGFDWHPMTVKRIESGEQPVKLSEAYALAEILHADLQEMTAADDAIPRRDVLITVHAYGLTPAERDAMFRRIGDAAHELDEEVDCSAGPLTAEYIQSLLDVYQESTP